MFRFVLLFCVFSLSLSLSRAHPRCGQQFLMFFYFYPSVPVRLFVVCSRAQTPKVFELKAAL